MTHWKGPLREREVAAMFLPHTEILSFTVGLSAYTLELADAITATMPQLGLDAGVLGQIIGIDLSLTEGTVKLQMIYRRVPAYSTSSYV